MSVETVAALEYSLPDGIELETSYLDPRGNSGPTIVDSHRRSLVPDTRVGVTADLAQVAHLNGFTLAPFVHQYFDRNTRRNVKVDCPAPAILDNNQETTGRTVLTDMNQGHLGENFWEKF